MDVRFRCELVDFDFELAVVGVTSRLDTRVRSNFRTRFLLSGDKYPSEVNSIADTLTCDGWMIIKSGPLSEVLGRNLAWSKLLQCLLGFHK